MKKILALALVVTMVFALCAVSASADSKYKISVGTTVAETHVWSKLAQQVADEMAEKTNGEVEITVYPGGSLGNEASMFEQMQMGTVDMVVAGLSTLSGFVPSTAMTNIPYLFSGTEAFEAACEKDSDMFVFLQKELEEKELGVSLLGLCNGGVKCLHSSKQINSFADIQGMAMRVPTSVTDQQIWSKLGTVPTAQSFNEVYSLMQSGIVELFDCTMSAFVSSALYEVAPYITVTDHSFAGAWALIADSTLNKLPAEYQEMLKEAVAKACLDCNEAVNAAEQANRDECANKYSCILTEVDVAPFQEALADFYTEYAEGVDGGLEMLEIIKSYN